MFVTQQRASGVICRPDTERVIHYVRIALPRQVDGYSRFDGTRAIERLTAADCVVIASEHPPHAAPEMP